jgi:hypothetical protein
MGTQVRIDLSTEPVVIMNSLYLFQSHVKISKSCALMVCADFSAAGIGKCDLQEFYRASGKEARGVTIRVPDFQRLVPRSRCEHVGILRMPH